jgi:hypothetical protein
MRATVVVYLRFICKYEGKEIGENYWERFRSEISEEGMMSNLRWSESGMRCV